MTNLSLTLTALAAAGGLAVTMSHTFYLILDLEFPRLGLIRVDAADAPLLELEKAMQ